MLVSCSKDEARKSVIKEKSLDLQKQVEEQKAEKEKELTDKQKKMETETKKLAESALKSKLALAKINTYIADFKTMYGREPIADEINNNVDVEDKYMNEFLATYSV